MPTTSNKNLIYKKVPTGLPVAGEHLVIEDRPIDLDAPAPAGGLVVKVLSASFDPYLRGRMRDPSVKSYSPPFNLDEPILNDTIGKVIKSDHSDFKEGDLVVAFGAIAEYSVIPNSFAPRVRKINNPNNLELSYFLGPLGMPGLTAFSAFYKIGEPKRGETIFISSAAGAVGQVVGQLAKHEGLKVIGSVGSDEKLDFLTKELGFDGGFNYKKEKPSDALPRLAPDGVDICFENVGGEHLEAALTAMNIHGRIIFCGLISDYNTPAEKRFGVKGLFNFISKRLKGEGFLVGEIGPPYAKDHQQKVQAWLADGTFKAKIHTTEGIDRAAEGLIGILKGDNFGKAVLKIADE